MGNMWGDLKVWLGVIAGVGVMMAPGKVDAGNDSTLLENNLFNNNGDSAAKDLNIGRHSIATDDYDINGADKDYIYPLLLVGKWAPKAVTRLQGHDLARQLNALNSYADVNFDLAIVIQDGNDFNGTNKLGVKVLDDAIYDPISSTEHWIISYNYGSDYYTGGAPRADIKNIRELCPDSTKVYYWTNSLGQGVGLNIPFADTNANGEVVFGTGVLHKELNQLTSLSTSGGTNSPTGSETVDYEVDRVVTNRANSGWFVDNVVVTRTGDTGERTVETNDVDGISGMTNYYETVVNGIKGSNSVNATYSEASVPNHPFVFRDSSAGVDITNQVQNNAYWSTNFPRYLYPEDGKRLEAKTIDVLGVPVGLN